MESPPLLRLPNELLYSVFAHITEPDDLLHVALAHRALAPPALAARDRTPCAYLVYNDRTLLAEVPPPLPGPADANVRDGAETAALLPPALADLRALADSVAAAPGDVLWLDYFFTVLTTAAGAARLRGHAAAKHVFRLRAGLDPQKSLGYHYQYFRGCLRRGMVGGRRALVY